MSWTVEQALQHWQERKLLTKKKADELRAGLPDGAMHLQGRAIGIFTALGAILIGLGVILFVGSHWDELTATVKVALLLTAMLASGAIGYWLAFEKPGQEKTGFALLFLNVLIFGATIFLVAQIYHLPLDFWWGALLWFLGTAYFAYVLRSRLHLWLTVLLFLLTLGWLRTSLVSGDELDFLFDERMSLLPLLGYVGLGIVAESALQQRFSATRFAAPMLFHWGLFLIAFFLVLTTSDKEMFYTFLSLRLPLDVVGMGILALSLITAAAALIFGTFSAVQGRAGFCALIAYLLFVTVLAHVPTALGMLPADTTPHYSIHPVLSLPMLTGLFILHIVLVFVFCLSVIWFGSLLRRPAVINLGMIAVAFCILIQYFSWAFELLPRSFAFILGGAVILILGFVLERQRRRLIAAVA